MATGYDNRSSKTGRTFEEQEVSTAELDRVLSSIGEDPKRTLLFHLQASYGITLDKPSIPLEDLERALQGLVGKGASLILGMIESGMTEHLR